MSLGSPPLHGQFSSHRWAVAVWRCASVTTGNALAFSGCTVGPPVQHPAPDVSSSPRDRADYTPLWLLGSNAVEGDGFAVDGLSAADLVRAVRPPRRICDEPPSPYPLPEGEDVPKGQVRGTRIGGGRAEFHLGRRRPAGASLPAMAIKPSKRKGANDAKNSAIAPPRSRATHLPRQNCSLPRIRGTASRRALHRGAPRHWTRRLRTRGSASLPPRRGRVEFHLDRWSCAYAARTSCGRAGARPSPRRCGRVEFQLDRGRAPRGGSAAKYAPVCLVESSTRSSAARAEPNLDRHHPT